MFLGDALYSFLTGFLTWVWDRNQPGFCTGWSMLVCWHGKDIPAGSPGPLTVEFFWPNWKRWVRGRLSYNCSTPFYPANLRRWFCPWTSSQQSTAGFYSPMCFNIRSPENWSVVPSTCGDIQLSLSFPSLKRQFTQFREKHLKMKFDPCKTDSPISAGLGS